MRLPVFIVLMVCAALGVAVISYSAGAGIGSIVLRVIATLFVLQVAYFLLLLLTSVLSKSKPAQDESAQKADPEPLSKTQKQ